MPETIIAGVDIRRPDDTRDCLALATRVAQLADAELLAISVLTPSPSLDVARCEQELRRIVEATTSEAGAALAFAVRAVPARSPGRILYEFSERTHAAAVVIGSSLRDSDGRWMPGSVAESLLHGGRWPVVVAPHRFAERSDTALRIIGAGFEDTAEAREALRHAARLAESARAELRVIAVVEPFLFSHIAMGHEHEGLEVEHALRQRTESSLAAAVAGLPEGVHCEPVLIDGATVPALTRLSAGLDLLVLGSCGYGAEGAVLLGPVSRELVRNAQGPCHTAPPGHRAHSGPVRQRCHRRRGVRGGVMATRTIAPATAVRPLGELSAADIAFAGGKAANLGELTRAGLPVPAGFVIGAPVHAAFCDETGLRGRITAALEGVDVEDTAQLKEASARARDLVEHEPMPAWLQDAIRAAYADLAGAETDAPVAVRSSATSEDTASASFAGMNETFLNVRGEDALIDAVRRCWRSLFGSRTVFYRAKRGFRQAEMDIAVVVQRQIGPRAPA